jgi:hypothetical protein
MQARPPVVAGRSEADLIESVAEGMVGMVVAAGFVVLDARHANDYDFVLGLAGLGIVTLLKRCGWRDRWVGRWPRRNDRGMRFNFVFDALEVFLRLEPSALIGALVQRAEHGHSFIWQLRHVGPVEAAVLSSAGISAVISVLFALFTYRGKGRKTRPAAPKPRVTDANQTISGAGPTPAFVRLPRGPGDV